MQRNSVPVIADGNVFTVIVCAIEQPSVRVYEITDVPDETLVTTPDDTSTVATDGLVLTQLPPPIASCRLMVPVAQTAEPPVIVVGNAFTVTITVAVQPVESK